MFYAGRCRSCGYWQGIEVRSQYTYVFKCRKCNKSIKFMKDTNKINVFSIEVQGPYASPVGINEIVALKNAANQTLGWTTHKL